MYEMLVSSFLLEFLRMDDYITLAGYSWPMQGVRGVVILYVIYIVQKKCQEFRDNSLGENSSQEVKRVILTYTVSLTLEHLEQRSANIGRYF